MELFGTYQVSFDHIRRQAIKCFALDLVAYQLLIDTTHDDSNFFTKAAYEALYSEELLAFAVAMRTKFYQGLNPDSSVSFISASGLLYVFGKDEESRCFTVKDVCDKIIHADSVQKLLEPGVLKPTTTLEGVHRGTSWRFSFSASLFFEGVLNWIDQCPRC